MRPMTTLPTATEHSQNTVHKLAKSEKEALALLIKTFTSYNVLRR